MVMLITFFVVGLALGVWGVVVEEKGGESTGRMFFGLLLTIGALIAFAPLMVGIYKIDKIYPAKIDYLKVNNAEIESRLCATIAAYQAYEKDAYVQLKPEAGADIVVAISLYPELKSDAMIVSLLGVYRDNNQTIRELELERLNRPGYAFWLYFGG